MILTNKHFVISLIIAPILAIIAYFAVDMIVKEPPKEAIAGQEYPLVAKSNCRYESGKCTFTNGDIELNITSENINTSTIDFILKSKLPIQGIQLAIAEAADIESGKSVAPKEMQPSNYQQTEWQITLNNTITETTRFLIVVALNDSVYFGETDTIFINYRTSFPQENMR